MKLTLKILNQSNFSNMSDQQNKSVARQLEKGKHNVISNKGGKENLKSYRTVNPNSISKRLEQSIKQPMCRHLENDKEIRGLAQGHVRNKSYQIDLISFFDSKTDIGDVFDTAYL